MMQKIPNIDRLILMAAQMVAFDQTLEEVRDSIFELCGSQEHLFYLVYTAGKLHAQATADLYKLARKARGLQ